MPPIVFAALAVAVPLAVRFHLRAHCDRFAEYGAAELMNAALAGSGSAAMRRSSGSRDMRIDP